jgi:hypothetical protein
MTKKESIIEILKYVLKKNSYKVNFDVSNANDSYIDTIKAKEFRVNTPFENSKIEREFFQDHNSYHQDRFIFDSAFITPYLE